jgi:hypothetical protein
VTTSPADLELDTSTSTRARQTGGRFADTNRADRLNRRILTGLSLLVLAAAGLGLAASYGAFGDDRAHEPVLTADLVDDIGDGMRWLWIGVGVLALVVAYLAWRWLRRMLMPVPAADDYRYPDTDDDERTTVKALAVADIVTAELQALPGVGDASSRLRPDGSTVASWVTVDRRTDVSSLRQSLEADVLPRVRRCLDREDLTLDVELRPALDEPERVH